MTFRFSGGADAQLRLDLLGVHRCRHGCRQGCQRTPASQAGVASAVVLTAECDVLHDDGESYAAALRRAGVPVEYREYAGMIHAFFGMVPAVDDAMNAQRTVWAAFKRAFATSPVGT